MKKRVKLEYKYNAYNLEMKIKIELNLVEEVEMDEIWSFIQNTKEQYWLRYTIDHKTGVIFAYCFR